MNQAKKMKFTVDPATGCLSEQDAKRYFTVIGFGVFALMLVFYGGNLALSLLCWELLPSLAEHAVTTHLISLASLYGMAFPVFYLIIRRLPRGIPSGEPMSGGRFFGGLAVAFFMMMAGNYVGQWLIAIFEAAMGRTQQNPVETTTSGVAWWINLIFVALIPCIMEELIFRKVLCDRLLPLGEGYAVVMSASAFGLVHGNFFQFFYAFLVGVVLATVYVKTGKLWVTILYHGAINLLGGVVAPWILERVSPIMTDANIEKINGYLEAGNSAALSEMLTPYMLPMMGLLAYEGIMMVGVIGGLVYFWKKGRKTRFQQGLLPVPRECRVSAVLLNVGTAAALTVFAGVFLLSLL